MVFFIRLIHGAITAFFLSCIAYIYYAGFTNQRNVILYIAIFMIAFESLIIVLNKGICPLGTVHKKLGDNKTFFELFLPKRLAKLAAPFLGVVTLIGILLLLI